MSRHTLSRGLRRATASRHRPIALLALAAAASLHAPPAARAADGTWSAAAAGTYNYSDAAQWLGGAVADGTGFTANFASVDPAGDVTVTLDTPRTLANLTFADTDPASAASWILAGTNTLTLAGPAAPTITVDALAAGKVVRIDTPLAGTQGFIKNGAGTLYLTATASPSLTGTGATINAGTILLGSGNSSSGANNITNPLGAAGTTVTLNAGTTIANGLGANPTATLQNNFTVNGDATINMGSRMIIGQTTTSRTITLNNGANLTFTLGTAASRDDIYANFAIGAGQPTPTVTFNGSGTTRLFINGGTFGAGFTNMNVVVDGSASLNPQTNSGGNTINLGSLSGASQAASLGGGSAGSPTYSVGALGTNTTYAGGVSGNAILTKVGTGTLVLTNNTGGLSSTAATNVNQGTLQIDGNKTGSGATVVGSGGTLAGNGTLAGTVTVNAGGHIAPGTATSVGTLTLSSLTLNAGSFIDTDFSTAGGNDSLISTGTLTVNGGSVNLYNEGGTTPFSTNGTYNLISFNSIGGLGVGGLGVANPQAGKVYTFATAGNFITLSISSAGGPVYWNSAAGGTWATGSNWTGGAAPDGQGAFAGFGGGGTPIAADATVSLNGATKTVGTLSFNSARRFTVAGGSIVLDNGSTNAAITDAAGSHTVSAPITLSTVGNDVNVVAAADSLTLSGALTGSGALNKVGAGTLVLAAANPNFTGAFTPSAGTTQIAHANAFQSATLNGGSGTLSASVPSLNVARLGTGTFNFASATQLAVGADGSSATFSGSLTGPVTLVKQSGGYLYLAGGNSHSGGVVVNGGFLSLLATQSYTGGTTLNNGANLELFPNSSLSGDLTVSNNSNIYLLPTGLSGSPSIFPSFNIVLPANATANVNSAGLGNGLSGSVVGDASSTLVVQNQTSFNATAASANPKQFANMLGTVRVDGTLRFSATSLNNGGDSTTFDINGGILTTRNGGAVSLGELTGNGTLQQATTADGNTTYTIGLKGTSSTFSGTISDAANRQNNLVKAGTGTLTLAGSDNRANGSATTVNAGTLRLGSDAALSNTSPVTLNTGGTLDLNGHNVTAPSLAGSGGTLLLSANLSLNGSANTSFAGSIVGAGAVSKDGSATQAVGSVDAAAVTVNAGRLVLTGGAASRVANLTVSAAPLQLNSRLVLSTTSQNDAVTLVLLGRNGGAWDGLTGITTTADAHHGIAITSVSTLGTAAFPNLAGLTGAETLLVGTFYGDLNLDGKVNADDYALIDRGRAKGLTGWVNGDLNYDGVIDAADYFLMDSTYGAAGVPHEAWTALLSERQSQFGDAYVQSLIASVPEPTMLSLLGVAALPLLSRHRRSR